MCLFGKLLKMGKVAFTGMERLLRGRDGKWRTALSWGAPSRPSNVMRSPSELLRCVASLDPACVASLSIRPSPRCSFKPPLPNYSPS
jgi:hypothetical protein